MTIALLHKHYDSSKLEAVKMEMQTLGAPVIKAVWMECWNMWVALEGCHRLRAAHELGLEPVIDEVEYSDDTITLDSGDEYKISEIADAGNHCATLKF